MGKWDTIRFIQQPKQIQIINIHSLHSNYHSAGVLGIYGLIYSVIVLSSISAPDYSTARGYAHFFGGLTLGLSCLASGVAVGIVGRDGIRSLSENKSSAVKLILNLIYCEALGLYGLIFALIAASTF